ncbi:Cytochrome oxidase biogenesis protein Sco1/SenC/PrrC, putative copper metallochaperone [Pseudohaliea rubra DSM 19751]|uniref:Cytochrome oxidase biogenesis protein Sco1/SenC/PrrC, putative copper metallochaperone n=2 Tax=Pseudohaliea TaxID=1341120 RepID=A0A095VTX6_9GAMM|nr:Cytochrome oxidase biogenesis protein Sco1/SenC/PrrC, putative copper metallochaperone [Pseudohaliea rubra DSM 19751]
MSGASGKPMTRGIRLTIVGVLAFVLLIVAGFVHRIQQPRVLTVSEMRANGLFLLDTPRELGDFALVDHRGEPFVPARLEGQWSLVFFGFTHCPDICPTTMAFLDRLAGKLEGTEAEDTAVFMVSVDPARDTVDQLASYVPYFNDDFTGVTGEFLDLYSFATKLNAPFRKVPGQGEDYVVDHSANVVLINPRGDYHGFFKAPLDLAKMKVTLRSALYRWNR